MELRSRATTMSYMHFDSVYDTAQFALCTVGILFGAVSAFYGMEDNQVSFQTTHCLWGT